MTKTNVSQPLTVVTNNFILDATDVQDPLCQDFSLLVVKLVRASVPIRLCTLCVLAVQSSTIALEQRSADS